MKKTNKVSINNANGEQEDHKSSPDYVAPDFVTEELMAFGALCNGTTIGGRKAAVGAPSFCNATKINS